MKISELIQDMQEVLDNAGDLDVEIVYRGEHGTDFTPFVRADGLLATDYVISVQSMSE